MATTPRALRAARAAGLGVLLLLGALSRASITPAAEAIVVIVHPERAAALDRAELRRIWLRQRRLWDDGASIMPVSREAGSEIRTRFESEVLGRSSEWLARYWAERYFEGVLPPITFVSDEAVRRYVAKHPEAIGYVASTTVDASVHVAWPARPAPRP